MIDNNLPQMSDADRQMLEKFVSGSSPEAVVLRRTIEMYLEHFRDIRNVDPRDRNVGLQVCSHLRAYDMLEEIFSQMKACERSERTQKNKSFR